MPTRYYLTASRRIIPAILGFVLLFVGCTGPATPQGTLPPTKIPTATSRPPTLTAVRTWPPTPTGRSAPAATRTRLPTNTPGGVTVSPQGEKVSLWYLPSFRAAELGDEMPFLVNEFNRTNTWGVTLDATPFHDAAALSEAVKQASAAGGLPDMLMGHTYELVSWDAGGRVLADLTPYVSDPAWGLSADEEADFYSVFWDHEAVNGKRLGLPFQRTAVALYYNVTWAAALGFDRPPETPEDFGQQACAAAQANQSDADETNDGTGGYLVSADAVTLAGWVYAFGGEIAQPGGSGYQFDTTETTDALEFLRGLQDQGCAWASPDTSPETEFAARRALFRLGGTSTLDVQQGAFKLAGRADQWTVIPFPSPEGQPVMSVYGVSLAVVKSTPEGHLAAWLAARWLAAPENQARWIWSYGGFPTRASTSNYLDDYAGLHPQWQAMLDLWLYAREEPTLPSWRIARWAVDDAAAQLFAPDFEMEQIPAMLETLDEILAEINVQIR